MQDVNEYLEDNIADVVESNLSCDKFWELLLDAVIAYEPAMEYLRQDVRDKFTAQEDN